MENYEMYFENINDKKKRKEENISFKQILDDAIQEKKELDIKERDKKKANKLKQLKMLRHKKNYLDYSNKYMDISNKENINNNIQSNNSNLFGEQNEDKELNKMNLD